MCVYKNALNTWAGRTQPGMFVYGIPEYHYCNPTFDFLLDYVQHTRINLCTTELSSRFWAPPLEEMSFFHRGKKNPTYQRCVKYTWDSLCAALYFIGDICLHTID